MQIRNRTLVVFGISLCIILFGLKSFAADSTYTTNQISLGLDYAMAGLTKEAKDILIPLLHDDKEPSLDSKVRYFVGAICFFLDSDINCANYYWERIVQDDPNGPEASAVRGFMRNAQFLSAKLEGGREEDWNFKDDLTTARRFWSVRIPDYKADPKDLLDEDLATGYYDMLLAKYSDPRKHALLLFEKFFILAGFNNENYGYMATKRPDAFGSYKKPYLMKCRAISDSLKMMPEGQDLYVHSQFLLGVMTSGTKFLSSDIKLNDVSAKCFENVIEATKGENTNLLRIFAGIWLKKYSDK